MVPPSHRRIFIDVPVRHLVTEQPDQGREEAPARSVRGIPDSRARRLLLSRPSDGIWLTLLSILLVETISRTLFVIPQPSSLYLVVVAAATTLGGMRIGLI